MNTARALCIAVALALSYHPAATAEVEDLTAGLPPSRAQEKLAAARRINEGPIAQMGLIGLSMRVAADKLMARGFSCGVEAADPVFKVPASLLCTARAPETESACEVMLLNLRGPLQAETRGALVGQLERTPVTTTSVLCPFPLPEAKAGPALAGAANVEAASFVDRLAAIGRPVPELYERLLGEGFLCGESRPDVPDGLRRPTLRCRGNESTRKHCATIEVTFEADSLSPSVAKTSAPLATHADARLVIRAVRGRCTVLPEGS